MGENPQIKRIILKKITSFNADLKDLMNRASSPRAWLFIPLRFACFAAVFISSPTPALARDEVPFNGATVATHVVNFGKANHLEAFTGTAEIYPNP